MQKWECYEVNSLSHLSPFLNPNSDYDLDIVLIDHEFIRHETHGAVVSKLRNLYENVCIVAFVNFEGEVKRAEDYELIVCRPLMDGDIVKIFHVCDVLAIRSLLWLK